MKKIVLFRSEQGWMAQFVGDGDIFRLFGTDIIPTAFTVKAHANRVKAAIKNSHPDCLVVLA